MMLKKVFSASKCLQTFWSKIWVPYVHILQLKWWTYFRSLGDILVSESTDSVTIKHFVLQNDFFSSLFIIFHIHWSFQYRLSGIKSKVWLLKLEYWEKQPWLVFCFFEYSMNSIVIIFNHWRVHRLIHL